MNSADTRGHNTASLDCWCQPRYYAGCPDCGPEMHDATHMREVHSEGGPPCLTCSASDHKGLVRVDLGVAMFRAEGVLVIHNDLVS